MNRTCSSEKTPIDVLVRLRDKKVHVTRECWFNAQRRLENHNRYSLLVITLLSIALVALSIATGFKLSLALLDEVSINVISTVFSVTLLAYSCIVAKSDYALRAERFLRSGRELDDLEREMQFYLIQLHGGTPDDQVCKKIQEFSRQYTEILDATENQRELDHLQWKIKKGDEHRRKRKSNAKIGQPKVDHSDSGDNAVAKPEAAGKQSEDEVPRENEISDEERDLWKNKRSSWRAIFVEYCIYWFVGVLALFPVVLVAWGIGRAAMAGP